MDTQVFLWASLQPHSVSEAAGRALTETASVRHLSAVSGFEIATKVAIGKLRIDLPVDEFIARGTRWLAATTLPVTMDHALGVGELPRHHRDPFDRLLIAQARSEGLALVSADPALTRYDVEVIW